MSKTVSVNLLAHLQGETLTIATLWSVLCKDTTGYFFTDHDEDIVFNGDTYKAATGYTRSSISSSVALDVDQLQIEGLIDDVEINEADLRSGKFDFASVTIAIINYNSVADGIMYLRQGFFGEVALKDQMYVVELRGLSQLFSNEILRTFTADCAADLGDSRCTIDLNLSDFHQNDVAVTDKLDGDNQIFECTGLLEPGVGSWDFGHIVWVNGPNQGRIMEIKLWDSGSQILTLFLPMPLTVSEGDEFNIFVGCDKLVPTCRDTFNNLNNYRGFPFIPTIRDMLRTPDSTSSGYSSGGS